MTTDATRRAAMARNIAANARIIDEHQKVFDGLTAAGFRAVKVNAPLWEKQDSGQWACIGCSCGPKSDTRKQSDGTYGECKSTGKHPIGGGWQNQSTADWTIARQWLGEGYNLGVYPPTTIRAMGVDADRPAVFEAMFPDGVPDTMGDELAGKRHKLFRVPDGIDLDDVPREFDGGEVSVDGSRHLVAPLGLHPNGRRKWNGITEIIEIPLSALEWLQRSKRQADEKHDQAKGPGDEGWKIRHGEGRYEWLTREAGKLRNSLPTQELLLTALLGLNEARCEPPVEDSFVERLARNYWERKSGPSAPHWADSADVRPLTTRPLSDFTMRQVEWLWRRWIAREETTFIEGLSGLGKSTFYMDVIARLTTGREMPDGSPHPTGRPLRVLYITPEDDPERVLVGRAMAAGADRAFIEFVTDKFTMPEDARRLLETIRQSSDVALVFIDPLFSHVGTDKDGKTLKTGDDVQMRTMVMEPLNDICRQTKVAIALGRHLNKMTNQDIGMRGSGSYGGLYGRARGVILVVGDPRDEEHDLKVVGPIKQQYSARPPALRFAIWGTNVTDELGNVITDEDGEAFSTSVIRWQPEDVGTDIETYLMKSETVADQRQAKRDDLDDLIRGTLHFRCVKSTEFDGICLRAGYGDHMIRDARKRVGVVAHQHQPSDWHVRLGDVTCSKVNGAAGGSGDPTQGSGVLSTVSGAQGPLERETDPRSPEIPFPICLCGAPKTITGGCSDRPRHREWSETEDMTQGTRSLT